MEDKSNELVTGDTKKKAIMQCLSCACLVPCTRENRPIYTDSEGNCTNWVKGISEEN